MRTLSLRVGLVLVVGWLAVAAAGPDGATLQKQRQALLQQKVELLKAALEQTEKLAEAGRGKPVDVQQARIALYRAQLTVLTDPAERAKIHTMLIAVYEDQERAALARFRFGGAGYMQVVDAQLAVVEAKIAKQADAARESGDGPEGKKTPPATR